MRYINKKLFTSLTLFSMITFAKTTSSLNKEAGVNVVAPNSLETYLHIQKKLASDSFEGVVEAAKLIQKNERGDLSEAGLILSKSKNIKEARENFKKVSNLLIRSTSEKDRRGAKVAFCPMAQARWLQRGDTIENPYYGASMLECGRFETPSPFKK
jgi:hypothetical protein